MDILVTGGAGFVGGNLIERLLARGAHRVRVLDSEVLGKREFIADLEHEFIKGDIRDRGVVEEALSGIDAVVHLAADTRVIPSVQNPEFNMDVNVRGSFNILEAMRRQGTPRLVNASTGGAIMGEVPPPVHEDMAPNPMSPYGASKLAVEGYCSAYAASYGMNCISLRFSNVYGPRSFHKGSVVAQFMKQIMRGEPLEIFGDGSQTRDYVYAGDLSDGIIAGLTAPFSGPIQLGTGRPTSLNELVDHLRAVSGEDFEVIYRDFRSGEVVKTYCKIDRARQILDYRPDTGLREGLAKTWAWFNDHKEHFAQ
jgi:UDP-glucose 4-epimerase